MIFEYTNENLSKEEIGSMLKESKVLMRNSKNMANFTVTIAFIMILLFLYIIQNFSWNDSNLILIIVYVIVVIKLSFKKEFNFKSLQWMIYNQKGEKQVIEFKEKSCIHRSKKLNLLLNKQTVREIITSKEYTLIQISPRRLKSLAVTTIFIPNNLLGSKEKYNEFINMLSQK